MKHTVRQLATSKISVLIAGVFLGALLILGIRFATYHKQETHYHANFALYINGQREQFKGALYYTDTQMCSAETLTPALRAHMHDYDSSAVHVEGEATTWSNFFDNIGWTLSPTAIITQDGTVYAEDAQNKLHFYINGQDYTDLGASITNRVIGDKDRLLISYGSISDATILKEYNSIPQTAQKYDTEKDPASCSGNHETTVHDRMSNIF